MAQLKSATAPMHQQLESAVGLPRSLDQYLLQLRGFFGFLSPLENQLAAVAGIAELDFFARRKIPSLMADLAHWKQIDVGDESLPVCTRLPRTDTLARAGGVMYVFEGSTLGGQIIARHLEHQLDLRDGVGYRYFRGHAAETAHRWRRFGELLEHAVCTPEQQRQAVEAATETFVTFSDWMQQQK